MCSVGAMSSGWMCFWPFQAKLVSFEVVFPSCLCREV
jgi:hypothetical protein